MAIKTDYASLPGSASHRRAVLSGLGLTAAGLISGAILSPTDAADRPIEILAFGDSLSAGLGLPSDQAFPARLEAQLQAQGLPVKITNAGVSGETTAGGVARLGWVLGTKPALVMLELGANDALRGIDPAQVRANLEKMIATIQANGAKLLLIGMHAPPNWGSEYEQNFNRIYPELAQAHNLPLYPFILEGVAMDPKLNQPDGLHPNERGVAVIVDHLAPLVAKLVLELRGGQS